MGKLTTAGVSIVLDGSSLKVQSPYHPYFVQLAQQANGRWSSPFWVFDLRDEARIREACRECYGTDGSEVPAVDVRVDLDVFPGHYEPSYYGLGRLLVERKSRDYRVKLGPGVVVISGGFPSNGGSVKNPRPDQKSGTILEVRDVPAGLARKFAAKHPGISIVEGTDNSSPAEEQCWLILQGLSRSEALAILAKLQARISADESEVNS